MRPSRSAGLKSALFWKNEGAFFQLGTCPNSPVCFLSLFRLCYIYSLILYQAVYSLREQQRKLCKDQQYIHRITDSRGIQMVVTMLPRLAVKMHAVHASLHDNTYKRTFGKWNEWEVVIWDSRLNTRESGIFLEYAALYWLNTVI
jgi:hypothetical protein